MKLFNLLVIEIDLIVEIAFRHLSLFRSSSIRMKSIGLSMWVRD